MRRATRWALDAMRSIVGGGCNLVDPPVLVLLYHRVTTLPRDPQRLAVSPENFHKHLEWLKARFPILRFEDDWRSARRPAVVVTFDDGYADNALEALPILEETGVPATFFISTGNLGTRREFWWDEVERCVEAAPPGAKQFALPLDAGGRVFPTRSSEERSAIYEALHPVFKTLPIAAREGSLAALREWAGLVEEGRDTHRALAVQELRALAASRFVSLGAHAVNHAPLSRLSADAQRSEIDRSRRDIEQLTGNPVRLFAYPFGGTRDYDKRSVELCREAGFAKAAANVQGSWHRWHDDLQIPRRLVRNWDLDTFASRIHRYFRQ
jgi:peptidoglycan/xylan/chitin deacetylase (PgdA/CDA1 family)